MSQSNVALSGPFPFEDGRRAPARVKANCWYSETSLLEALWGHWPRCCWRSPESNLEVHCTPIQGEPISWEESPNRLTNWQACKHRSNHAFSNHWHVGQSDHDGELSGSGFFYPTPIVLRVSADEGWEAGFMVFTIKPWLMLSLEWGFQRRILEVIVRARLWQKHLRNEESIFQDPNRVIFDEARIHANTHTKHSKSQFHWKLGYYTFVYRLQGWEAEGASKDRTCLRKHFARWSMAFTSP
jgi:hypothetical protein